MAMIAIGVCQWSGTAIVIASTDLSSRILRKSFRFAGWAPLMNFAACATPFASATSETSHT